MLLFVVLSRLIRRLDGRMTRRVNEARTTGAPTPYPRSRHSADHWWDDGCDTFDSLHP